MKPGTSARLMLSLLSLVFLNSRQGTAQVVIGDSKSQPESLAAAPDGTLLVGSASSPYIYRVRPAQP